MKAHFTIYQNKMDCSICLEQITKTTGCTTLSCEHSFHFRCISEWFLIQRDDALSQVCPCCRNEGADLDRCKKIEIEEDEEEDSLDFDYTLPEMGEWIVFTADELAFENSRDLFEPLNELEVEDEDAAAKLVSLRRNENADLGLLALE